jgi:hypothetical protein
MTKKIFFTPLFYAVFGSGIRDPGSGINIPDPQHCRYRTAFTFLLGIYVGTGAPVSGFGRIRIIVMDLDPGPGGQDPGPRPILIFLTKNLYNFCIFIPNSLECPMRCYFHTYPFFIRKTCKCVNIQAAFYYVRYT